MKKKWKNSGIIPKNPKIAKSVLKPSLTESLFDIRKRSLLSILNSIPPTSPIEKKSMTQKMELSNWRDKKTAESKESSIVKRMKNAKALAKFEGSGASRKKCKSKVPRVEALRSAKQALRDAESEARKQSQPVKERMSLVFSQHVPQSSPNYNSNTEKRLFKGASQREFNQLSELQKKVELGLNVKGFDFRKMKRSLKKPRNLIEVPSEYGGLSFLRSGASSRRNSPNRGCETQTESQKHSKRKKSKSTKAKLTNRLPLKYRSKKSIFVSNKKKVKDKLNSSSRASGVRAKVNLGLLENVYNRSTKLIQSPNLYNEKFSQEKSISKQKRKSHGLNKIMVEFQQNFHAKKRPKNPPSRHNLHKLVKNFTHTKSAAKSIFDKRRSFTQKLSDTMNLLKKSNKTYNHGAAIPPVRVNTSEFREMRLVGRREPDAAVDAKLPKTKNKRKSLTTTSWYKNGKKMKTLKRYPKKGARGPGGKRKKHSLKTKKQESGDSGISFGEKDSKLNMAKSETVPGFVVDHVNFRSSSDNKSSFAKVIPPSHGASDMQVLVGRSKSNVTEFPFSKLSGPPDSRGLPSIYLRSHSELEANESNSIFSPKIDKDFVLSKEDNQCFAKTEAFQNNYNFHSNPDYPSRGHARVGVSLKNLEQQPKLPDKRNIYEVNSIEKFPLRRDKFDLRATSNFSNYSNYVGQSGHHRAAKGLFKSQLKVSSSNTLNDMPQKEFIELPSFKPATAEGPGPQRRLRETSGEYPKNVKKKKLSIKKLNRLKKTFEFVGDVSTRSRRTPRNTDRNREGCKTNRSAREYPPGHREVQHPEQNVHREQLPEGAEALSPHQVENRTLEPAKNGDGLQIAQKRKAVEEV